MSSSSSVSVAPVSPPNTLLVAYLHQLATHPLRTKSVTGGKFYPSSRVQLNNSRIYSSVRHALLYPRNPRLSHRRHTLSLRRKRCPFHHSPPCACKGRHQSGQDGRLRCLHLCSPRTRPRWCPAEAFRGKDRHKVEDLANISE